MVNCRNRSGNHAYPSGSCHCGAVKFEIDVSLSRLGRCNCSICSKQGALFVRILPAQFRLLEGDDKLTLYQFNTGLAEHYFCKRCGMHPPFRHPRSGPNLYLVNARCLDDFDIEFEVYEVSLFDGRIWEAADAARKAPGDDRRLPETDKD